MLHREDLQEVSEVKLPTYKGAKKLAHTLFSTGASITRLSCLIESLARSDDGNLASGLWIVVDYLDALREELSSVEDLIIKANGLDRTYFPGWERDLEKMEVVA